MIVYVLLNNDHFGTSRRKVEAELLHNTRRNLIVRLMDGSVIERRIPRDIPRD